MKAARAAAFDTHHHPQQVAMACSCAQACEPDPTREDLFSLAIDLEDAFCPSTA